MEIVVTKFLNQLNGWQRFYAVLLFFIYIPLCLLSVCDISVGKVDTFKLLESSKELQEIWRSSGISLDGINFMDIISELERRRIKISEKTPEINRNLSEKQKALKYLKELEEQRKREGKELGFIPDKDETASCESNKKFEWSKYPIIITDEYEFWVGGYVYKMSIPINFKEDKNTRDYYKKIYKNTIESEHRNQLSKEIIVLICMQIIAAFVFYAFFYSIGWVYKGFKK